MDVTAFLIPGLVIAAVATLPLVFRQLSRKAKLRAEESAAVKAAVLERYGLTDRSPGGIRPDLQGDIDGLTVAVDEVLQSYARSGDGSGNRPWTRVRVQLDHDPGIVVQARTLNYPETVSMPEQVTGDALFDADFRVFAIDRERVDRVLNTAARRAFLDAPLPISFSGKVVYWLQARAVRDPALLLSAIDACVEIGRAIRAASPDTPAAA